MNRNGGGRTLATGLGLLNQQGELAMKSGCQLLAAAVIALVGAFSAHAALPDSHDYPKKPIRLVTHAPAGTSPDVVARLIGERLSRALGQPIIVENRPGAGGTIALGAVAKAQPDGYTLGTFTLSHAVAPGLLPHVPYDTLRDLAPIRQTTQASMLLVVRAESPLQSVSQLIAAAKAQPGGLAYASPGSGSPPHLVAEMFKLRASIDIHHVPYKGAPAATNALLGQQVQLLSTSGVAVMAQIRSGMLRPLAVTGAERMPAFAGVPTLAELGLHGFDVRDWQGLVAPSETPVAVINRLAAEVANALDQPEIRERVAAIGLEPVTDSNPDTFGRLIRSELARWPSVVREAGIRLD